MGVVHAARATGVPVVPTAFIAPRKTILRSWDRFEIPHFFTRGVYLYGDPIVVPRKLSKEDMEQKRMDIERSLNDLSETGEERFEQLWKRGGN